MRPLLTLLALAVVNGEDPLPFLDLTVTAWPAPPPTVAAWWTPACADGLAWFTAQGLGEAPPSLRGRWQGWIALPGPGGSPRTALSGWWQAAGTPPATPWPGTRLTQDGDRWTLSTHGAPVPDRDIPPGLQAEVLGRVLVPALVADQPPARRGLWEGILAPCTDWTLSVRIDGAEADLRWRGPRTPLPATVAWPVDTVVAVALPVPATTWSPGTLVIARLPPPQRWGILVPDGPQTHERLHALAGQVPAAAEAVAARGGGWWVRRQPGGWWLSATDAVPAWGSAMALPAGATAAAHLPHGLAGLTARERWPWTHAPAEATLLTTDAEGRVTCAPALPTLGWWGAAAAIGWVADALADRAGCAAIERVLADLEAQGVATTLATFQATLPAGPDPTAWQRQMLDLDKSLNQPALEPTLQEDGLPVAPDVADPEQSRAFLRTVEPLLAQDPALVSALPYAALPATGNPAMALLPHTTILRQAAQAGQRLVLAGDAQGLAGIRRALAVGSQPRTLIEHLVRVSMTAMSYRAVVAAAVQGLPLTEEDVAAPPPRWSQGTTLQGEVLIGSWLARQLIAGSTTLPSHHEEGDGDAVEEMHTRCRALGEPGLHGGLTQAVAALLAHRGHQLRTTGEPMPEPVMPPSLSVLQIAPMIGDHDLGIRVQHELTVLFLRCWSASLAAEPPATTAAMEQRLGQPVAIALDQERLPCTWTLAPTGARRLAIDLSGPRPQAIPARVWDRWRRQRQPDLHARFFQGPVLIQAVPPAPPRPAGF